MISLKQLMKQCTHKKRSKIKCVEGIINNNSINVEKPKSEYKKKQIVLIDDDLKSWIRTYIRQKSRQ